MLLRALLDWRRALLGGASGPAEQLAVTAAVVLASVALVAAAGRGKEALDAPRDGDEQGGGYTLLGLRPGHLVPVVQGELLVLTLVALVGVWGLADQAAAVLAALGDSVPTLVAAALTVLLLVGAYLATDLLAEFVERVTRRSDSLDQHQAEILYRVLQVVLFVFAGTVGLYLWDVDPGGLLVGAGFLGIVVGMAARQTLGSMLAGFVLMFSRPFEVGDWIEVDGREGRVTDITVVNTRLENFDGEYVVIPNDAISNSTVVNRTRKGRLRIRLEVGVDYSVDPGRAEEVALEAITGLDEVMPVPRPQVVPTRFGDSAIVLELRFWIDKPSARRRWRARGAVLRSVYAAFDAEGIKIPYPQRELTGRGAVDRPGDPADEENAPGVDVPGNE